MAKLARWLCEEGIVKGDPELAEQAARLCKADLVTEMVGEFPDLQGLMGGYYAAKEGLPVEVSDAIRDHYKPVGQGDEVPTAPVTVAVSLADKMDTLASFFSIDEKPTGSKDPFALRRAALGVLRLLVDNEVRLALSGFASRWLAYSDDEISEWLGLQNRLGLSTTVFGKPQPHNADHLFHGISPRDFFGVFSDTEFKEKIGSREGDILDFFADRLKVQQREAGVRHDIIDAVFALGGEDDLVRLLDRVKALQSFVETEDGTNLLAGYKRAANILKKEEWDAGATNPLPEPAEAALIAALETAEPKAAAAIEAEDFAAAMSALATLRAPIDNFFEDVIVNAEEKAVRSSRLDLLARFRDAVHNVADFSKIEG